MPDYQHYQQQLLDLSRRFAAEVGDALDEAITAAFLATPRHCFVKRYCHWPQREWQEVTEENLAQHLPVLYSNDALLLWGDDPAAPLSSISQPSLVLGMLQLLKLAPGQQVFELGAGSGWNAALMGRLVAPTGHVYSMEIIPEMAQQAAAAVAALAIDNVSIIAADGGDGYPLGAPYDRAIFTAGAYDLPRHFYSQLKDGALLLFILKAEGGGDTLILLQKHEDHFASLQSFPVGFVPMTGKYALETLKPLPLDSLPGWATLQHQEISRTPFWWGGRGGSQLWRTQGIRSFLAITEPGFRLFVAEQEPTHSEADSAGTAPNAAPKPEEFFGLWDEANQSLVLARHEQLIAYGNVEAHARLLRSLHYWVDVGMPAAASFSLRIYRSDQAVAIGEEEWLVKRAESQFVWRLP